MTGWDELASLLGPATAGCKGFPNGCRCDRCLDRELRSRAAKLEGRPDAASRAERESAEYFKQPWRYDHGTPPMPLADDGT